MLPTVELAAGSLPLVVIGCQKNLHQATTATPQNAGRMWKKTGYLVGGFNHLEKYESQWEGLSHILWKIKNVPNHQPDMKIWGNYQPWHEETRDVVHPCLHPKWKNQTQLGCASNLPNWMEVLWNCVFLAIMVTQKLTCDMEKNPLNFVPKSKHGSPPIDQPMVNFGFLGSPFTVGKSTIDSLVPPVWPACTKHACGLVQVTYEPYTILNTWKNCNILPSYTWLHAYMIYDTQAHM